MQGIQNKEWETYTATGDNNSISVFISVSLQSGYHFYLPTYTYLYNISRIRRNTLGLLLVHYSTPYLQSKIKCLWRQNVHKASNFIQTRVHSPNYCCNATTMHIILCTLNCNRYFYACAVREVVGRSSRRNNRKNYCRREKMKGATKAQQLATKCLSAITRYYWRYDHSMGFRRRMERKKERERK